MGADSSKPSSSAPEGGEAAKTASLSSTSASSATTTVNTRTTSEGGPAVSPSDEKEGSTARKAGKGNRVNPVTITLEQQAQKRAEASAKAKEARDMLLAQRELAKLERNLARDQARAEKEEEKRKKAEAKEAKEAQRQARAAERERRRIAEEALEAQKQKELAEMMENHDEQASREAEEARRLVAQTMEMARADGGVEVEEDSTNKKRSKGNKDSGDQKRPTAAAKSAASSGDAALDSEGDESSVEVSSVNSSDYRDEELLHEFNMLVLGPRADELTEQIASLKKQAVAKNKEGDKAGALELMRTMKALEKELAEIMAAVMPPEEDEGDAGAE